MSRDSEVKKFEEKTMAERPTGSIDGNGYEKYRAALINNGWALEGNYTDENVMRRLFAIASNRENAHSAKVKDKLNEILSKKVYNLHDRNDIYRDLGAFLQNEFPKKSKVVDDVQGNDLRYYVETIVTRSKDKEVAQMRTQRHVGRTLDVIENIQSIDEKGLPKFTTVSYSGHPDLNFESIKLDDKSIDSIISQFNKKFGPLMASQNAIAGDKNIFEFVTKHFKVRKPDEKRSVNIDSRVKNEIASIKKKNKNFKPAKGQEQKYLDAFAAAYIMYNMTDESTDLFFEPYYNAKGDIYDRKDPISKYLNLNIRKRKSLATEDMPPELLEHNVNKLNAENRFHIERNDLTSYDKYSAVFNNEEPFKVDAKKTIAKLTPKKLIDKMKKNGWNEDAYVTNIVNIIFDMYDPEKKNSAVLENVIKKLSNSKLTNREFLIGKKGENAVSTDDNGISDAIDTLNEIKSMIDTHRIDKSFKALSQVIDRTINNTISDSAYMKLNDLLAKEGEVKIGDTYEVGGFKYKALNAKFGNQKWYEDFLMVPGADNFLRKLYTLADDNSLRRIFDKTIYNFVEK